MKRFAVGAPIAFAAPVFAYILMWLVAWVAAGTPFIGVRYWPTGIFCGGWRHVDFFCGGRAGDLEYMLLGIFIVACIAGWEIIIVLFPHSEKFKRVRQRAGWTGNISRILSVGFLALPLMILVPHVLATLEASPGGLSWNGWGAATLVDFALSWRNGAAIMLAYVLVRRSVANDW